jgi:hypothetical protein
MPIARALRWFLPVILIAAALWSANLALFNWWAAGGPPTSQPELFARRGNYFATASVLLLGSAVLVAIRLWRAR